MASTTISQETAKELAGAVLGSSHRLAKVAMDHLDPLERWMVQARRAHNGPGLDLVARYERGLDRWSPKYVEPVKDEAA